MGPTDAKVLAALLVGLLPTAFLGAYGHDVASRIKKFGPFELFEAREKAYSIEPGELAAPHRLAVGTAPGTARGIMGIEKPSERQRFYFERLDRYLHYLEYSASEPEKGAAQSEHFKSLFVCASFAFSIGEWTKAIYWFKHLEKLSQRTFRRPFIDNRIAMACLDSVLDKKADGREKELLEEAAERLSRLAHEHALDFLGYFWLAYVQDELEQWYEAVKSNQEALSRRPLYAPAKYNSAVSFAKLSQYRQAYDMLASIGPDDQFAKDVLNSAEEDDDLWDAVKDNRWKRRMLALVRQSRDRFH